MKILYRQCCIGELVHEMLYRQRLYRKMSYRKECTRKYCTENIVQGSVVHKLFDGKYCIVICCTGNGIQEMLYRKIVQAHAVEAKEAWAHQWCLEQSSLQIRLGRESPSPVSTFVAVGVASPLTVAVSPARRQGPALPQEAPPWGLGP